MEQGDCGLGVQMRMGVCIESKKSTTPKITFQLFYIEDLLETVKHEFCELFKAESSNKRPRYNFDEKFAAILRKYEKKLSFGCFANPSCFLL
jgi:hypothetical protein